MKNRAVFLDRDGTINVERHYLYKIEEFEFLPGVIEGLKLLQNAGFLLIIITNQSGIGRGYYSEQDFDSLNLWMTGYLRDKGIDIDGVYYCPHLPDAPIEKYSMVCNCRKPLLGMYEQAIRDYDIDINNSFAIGDKLRDCAICLKTNCRGFLISNNEKPEILEAVKKNEYKSIQYASDLLECAKTIISKSGEY